MVLRNRGERRARARKARRKVETNAEGGGQKGSHASIRTRHDELFKEIFALWLRSSGRVELDIRVRGEVRHGDVLFTERRGGASASERLGLLGRLARGVVLFEPFRSPPTLFELCGCLMKLGELCARAMRAARRAKRSLSAVEGPTLCVITPSMSRELAEDIGARPYDPGDGVVKGVYVLPRMLRTIVVVVRELSEDESTVWLRLLGRGSTQANALEELLKRSWQDPLAYATMTLFQAWRDALPAGVKESSEEGETAMNWQRVYARWEKRVKAEGKAEGKAEALLMVLEARGLPVTAVQRRQVLSCTDIADLDAWLRAAATTPNVKALLGTGGAPKRRARAA